MNKETFYKVNENIVLKLEGGKSFIYIQGVKFIQCMRLVLNILPEDIPEYDKINSIDEASEINKKHLYQNKIVHRGLGILDENQNHTITPEQEFWGHCSNLQVWVENGYNSRLLHSNLAFPLLKELVNIGDLTAKRIFKDEIIERFISRYDSARIFLTLQGYLNYLECEDLQRLIEKVEDFNDLLLSISDEFYNFINNVNHENALEFLFDFKFEDEWFSLLERLIKVGLPIFRTKLAELILIFIMKTSISFSIRVIEKYKKYINTNELAGFLDILIAKCKKQPLKDYDFQRLHSFLEDNIALGNQKAINFLRKF